MNCSTKVDEIKEMWFEYELLIVMTHEKKKKCSEVGLDVACLLKIHKSIGREINVKSKKRKTPKKAHGVHNQKRVAICSLTRSPHLK